MSTHYTATAKLIHWLMAALIFGLLALGFYMTELPFSPQKLHANSQARMPYSPQWRRRRPTREID